MGGERSGGWSKREIGYEQWKKWVVGKVNGKNHNIYFLCRKFYIQYATLELWLVLELGLALGFGIEL